MATTRTATTQWKGALLDGSGTVSLDSSGVGAFDVSWPSRAEEANGKTSPRSSSPPRTLPASPWPCPTGWPRRAPRRSPWRPRPM
nr:hypothetical protein GCM10020093_040500 [Planobispora longispora]